MFKFLQPDYYFHSIHDVDIDFFKKNNISAVLFDIDNTLEPYATELPSKKTVELFAELRDNGIAVAVISNNHEPRVKTFCSSLDVPFSFESGKPSSKKILGVLEELKVDRENTILVGDQLFTDVWGANNSGINSIFVDRINSDESFFIRLKRVIEIPFVKAIKRKGYGKQR